MMLTSIAQPPLTMYVGVAPSSPSISTIRLLVLAAGAAAASRPDRLTEADDVTLLSRMTEETSPEQPASTSPDSLKAGSQAGRQRVSRTEWN